MVTLVLPRLLAAAGPARRSATMIERNVATLRGAYWIVVLSGLLEPVLYLLSIGVGVGGLIGDLALPDGRTVGYAAFVAPAMLAASAMTGALSETMFNFFAKMKYQKLYDGMLATPIRPIEIAFGELVWAMFRGTLYAAVFLTVMVAMELTTVARAAVALPGTVLVGFTFGALGMALSTFMRSWQDFDLVGSVQYALFLFSGTFVPVQAFPVVLRWLIEITPLYRAVHLVRAVALGGLDGTHALDVAYLMVLSAVGLTVASRRMGRLLLS